MIKLFNSPVLGTAITDKPHGKVYLFSQDRKKYMAVPSSRMEEVSKLYKHASTLLKPYNVLVYEQVFKGRQYGLEAVKTLTPKELDDTLKNLEEVPYE